MPPAAPQRTPHRPNILVILVDDMGFSDIGCYGSEIRTPNLNRLAEGGLVFRQMYNCSRCCPTRASLLTGLYPHRAGIGAMVKDLGAEPYQGYLNDRCATVAELLSAGGYRTKMSGKWHVGGPYPHDSPSEWNKGDTTHPLPIQRGFEEHWGTLAGAGSYWKPETLVHNDTWVEPEADEDFYYTDAISDHACRMIDDCRRTTPDKPFFLYVAYTAPHWPLHARPEDIERYRGQYRKGWDAVRTARHEQLKGSGILEDRWEISPRDETVPPFDQVDDAEYQDMLMAVYAAQIDRMDQGVGRILATLERHRIEDDTVVMFLSDNGGCHEFIRHGSNWAQRLTHHDYFGQPVVPGDAPGVMPGGPLTYQSYNVPWANVSNTPFRMYKHWVHEGGIATPLIVHCPGRIRQGMTDAQCHVIDLLPTCLELAGLEYPEQYDGRELNRCDGESFASLFGGGDFRRERPLWWEHEGNRSARIEDWKLVAKFKGPWELYNLREDRTELTDLSGAKPDMLRQLVTYYQQTADRCGVIDYQRLIGG
ncbi:MAG: arylsulfatase [Phycisphaerae bacterium]